MRGVNWVGCIFAAGLSGCSYYPIPDDVSPFKTEEIVRYGRCEVRDAIRAHMIRSEIITEQSSPKEIRDKIDAAKNKKKTKLIEKEEHLLRLTEVAMVYSFDFNIIETNKAGADAGFRLPGLTNVLDVGGTAALDLTRQGSRVFSVGDNWGDLITDEKLCKDSWQRPGNIVYPATGSIGVGRVAETFIDIDEQGGAKDNFVDTLTFTTLASGGATASIKLDPVPNHLRPVSATAAIGASRLDIHKLTVSIAFPQPKPLPQGGIEGVKRADGDLNAPNNPFARPPVWRARYNLCVQDARTREASFKQLRLSDPLVYCIGYADEFAPLYGLYGRQQERRIAVTVTQGSTPQLRTPTESEPSGQRRSPKRRGRTESEPARTSQEPTIQSVRPNLRPNFF